MKDASPWEKRFDRFIEPFLADAMLGGQDAFLIIDDTELPKKGDESVVALRLYLPEAWLRTRKDARRSAPRNRCLSTQVANCAR